MPDPETAPLSADSPVVSAAAPVAPAAAPAAVAEPAPVAAAPEPSKTDRIIDLWFAECVQGTEVGRYTGAYNAVYAAKEELKRRLNKES